MKNINQHNYEAYFLDYWENRLNDEEREALFRYLGEHPELRTEFEDYEAFRYNADDDIVHTDKQKLKSGFIEETSHINAGNYEEYFIALVEQDLDRDLAEELEVFLHHNPILKEELALYGRLKLSADPAVTYPAKEGLYRKGERIITLQNVYRAAALAASLLILFGLYQFLLAPGPTPEPSRDDRQAIFMMDRIDPRKLSQGFALSMMTSAQSGPTPSLMTIPSRTDLIAKMPLIRAKDISMDRMPFTYHAGLDLASALPDMIIREYRLKYQESMVAAEKDFQDKTIFGKIISGMFRNVSNRVQPEVQAMEDIRPSRVSFWDLAESGINGYNYLTDSDVILVRTLDENGKTRKVRFVSE